jgi:hypothetical protein
VENDPPELFTSKEFTLNAQSWETGITVTVTAKDDNAQDGVKNIRVNLAPATSDDIRFRNTDPADVSVRVEDKATGS